MHENNRKHNSSWVDLYHGYIQLLYLLFIIQIIINEDKLMNIIILS